MGRMRLFKSTTTATTTTTTTTTTDSSRRGNENILNESEKDHRINYPIDPNTHPYKDNVHLYSKRFRLELWRVFRLNLINQLTNFNTFTSSSDSCKESSIFHKIYKTMCRSKQCPNRNNNFMNFNFSRGNVKKSVGFFRTVLVIFYLLLLVGPGLGCGPGRGAGRRRAPRKLTPLVYKQHVPNVPENTLSASGLSEGKITRAHPKFKHLVPNYNQDIQFRDDEGSGADRLMTQRSKEKLNTLAISVMNQWPGVKLRVIEGWDEEVLHAPSSLHFEGRAVDLTTSDKDRSKYGMLARLAVEAGFDWVYYESRAHIHCSVKSDSSQGSRTGGCFGGNMTVETRQGPKKISEISPGEEVLALDSQGQKVFSEVILFLDRNTTEIREFYAIRTESGRQLTLTPSHLIYRLLKDDPSNNQIQDLYLLESQKSQNQRELYNSEVVFARNLEIGDIILYIDDEGGLRRDSVVEMWVSVEQGVYAPLTKQGNVLVSGLLASCYAVIDDEVLAHWAFAPVRLAINCYEAIVHLWTSFSHFVTLKSSSSPLKPEKSQTSPSRNSISYKNPEDQGVHWYAALLYSVTKRFLPTNLLYAYD